MTVEIIHFVWKLCLSIDQTSKEYELITENVLKLARGSKLLHFAMLNQITETTSPSPISWVRSVLVFV